MQGIGSTISAAGANAAGQTTGLLAAAEDEVSAAIANLFGAYGQEYQAVLSQAATFHNSFTQALAAAASAYAQAEAANAGPRLRDLERRQRTDSDAAGADADRRRRVQRPGALFRW